MRTFDELLDQLESQARWNDPEEVESAKRTLRAMLKEAVAAERERCAKVVGYWLLSSQPAPESYEAKCVAHIQDGRPAPWA